MLLKALYEPRPEREGIKTSAATASARAVSMNRDLKEKGLRLEDPGFFY